ncbi:transcriptional regulator [Desulfosarcina ovata subsp. sediminis]|uniref:Transcriptional regulator n=1 Tax=Desulfosarcina ovata subsp. sediminis TaxID=885957 RepID=A0A5K7ZXX0_9BACT|nr:GntR family transcriptional regulator [Desulfosarcina ovata]BBO85099.1 transcriptional regulator [Desulfosarcina ovata subsp. sediminis]
MNAIPISLHQAAGSTADRIVGALRTRILQGRYPANAPLRQDTLAEELGVSKIPLREALVQLKAEGLVAFVPNRGFVVSAVSAAEVGEIYAMRVALETLALETAIPRLTEDALSRAGAVLDDIDRGADKTQWGELNWQFHATLYQAAGMPLLLGTIQSLHNNVLRYLIIYLDHLAASSRSQAQHREILAACRAGKIRQARAVLTRHLEEASAHLVALLS